MGSFTWRRTVQAVFFICGSICYALLGILSQLSKEPDGSYAYSLPSVVLTAEAVKLILSSSFLLGECGGSVTASGRLLFKTPAWMWLAFTVPSALYALNNNLDMVNNQHMDPATEQVLVQCKILTTALLWWLVFREPLGPRKWFALVLLFVGAVLAGKPSEALVDGLRTMYIDTIGIFLVITYVCVSASAGVYTEWLYKQIGKEESIHLSNIRLYSIGVLFNLGAHLTSSGMGDLSLRGFFTGYNRYVWGLVATYACLGLFMAQVMKWFNNIVKLFISCSSMYVSAGFSFTVFGYAPTLTFIGAMGLVTVAMLIYNIEKIQLLVRKEE